MVDGVIIKMSSDDIRRHIVCRMLNRREGIDVLPHRQHYNTARMLAGTSSDTCAPLHDPVDLAVPLMDLMFIIIFLYIAKRSLIRHGSDGPRPVGLSVAKDHLRVFMGFTLVFPRKIQIDIRFLVPHKTEECLKGNVKAVLHQHLPAPRAFFIRHITARAAHEGLHFLGVKIIVKTVRAPVVGT